MNLKKGAVFLLSSMMLFTSLGIANASDVPVSELYDVSNTVSVETVSVRDVVPEKYFESVKGKYQSKEALLDATGFKKVKSEKASKMQFDNGAIIVNNLEEYAALLQYYYDTEEQVNSNQLSISPLAINNDYDEETIWGDGLAGGANLSWITGIVSFKRHDSSGNYKIVSVTDTDSVLHGFHPGNYWSHSTVKTTYGINTGGSSGWAWIRGDRTLSIISGGIGEILTRAEAYYMTFN